VDHEELISAEAGIAAVSSASQADGHMRIAESEVSHLFGIEMTPGEGTAFHEPAPKRAVSAIKEPRHPGQTPVPKGKTRSSHKRQVSTTAIDKPTKERAQGGAGADRKGTRRSRASTTNQARTQKGLPVVSRPRTVTGKAVAKLRKKYNMSQAQFARLLGISPSTVGKWEKSEGSFNLRPNTQKAWDTVSKLKSRS
jgi:DNA-binding transcriptional regulator YiaG